MRQQSCSSGSKRCASTAATSSVERRAVGGVAERAVAHAAPGAPGDLRHLGRGQRGAGDGRRIWSARRRRHGRHPCSGPCRSRPSRPGNRLPCPGTAPPGRCGCAATAAPSPRRSRRAGGGSARRWRRPRPRRTRRRRCAAAGASAWPGRLCVSWDRRGRVSISASGTRRCSSGRMVSAPRNIVSTRPRACSSRSVKTWPRSGSAQSWISSTATNSTCAVERHRLDRAGKPARVRRDDLLLAGDQRDVAGALAGHHAVVVLARQQAQRKADDAGGVRQQALDRQMRLAGVGRTEHGLHPGSKSRHASMVGCCGAECKRQPCATRRLAPTRSKPLKDRQTRRICGAETEDLDDERLDGRTTSGNP